MASGPLDVALRVRWLYEAGGAKQATGDLDQVAAKAQKLGGLSADRLGRDLREVGGAAQTASRALTDTALQAAKLGGEGAGRLEAGLKRVEAPARDITRRLEDVSRAAARFGSVSTVSYLARDLQAVAAPADRARRELVAVGDAAGRLGRSDGVRAMSRELAEANREAASLHRRIDGLHRQGGPAGLGGGVRAHRHDFGNEALMASGLGGGLRFGMSGAAVGGLAAGAGIAGTAAIAAKATREAISFEAAMAEVRKAIDDISPEKFAALERTILNSSAATGIAKEQMAQLVAQAGFAGRPTEDLARFAEFGAKAAGAFGMTAEATGDALAKMGNVFKLSQAGIEDLADGINVLGDNTASREKQIVDFLYRTGSAGQAIGLTALQTGAIGAAIISTGKEAEVAATGFNALATKLGTADRQSKDFKGGLRDLGLSTRQIKADIAANPVEAILGVLDRINKLPDAKKLDVTSRIGGLEYGDDLLAYAGAVDQIRAALGKLQDQSTRAGSVEKTFKIFDATTQRNIARTAASIDGFATRIGRTFTPIVDAAAGAVERWFNGMNKAMDRRAEAEALASRMAKGEKLSPQEQARVDANPRLKEETDKALFFERHRRELEANRRKAETAPGELPSMEAFRQQQEERFRQWEERRQRALNPPAAPAPAAAASTPPAPPPSAVAPVPPAAAASPSAPPSMDEFRRQQEERFRRMEERRREGPPTSVQAAPPTAPEAAPLPGTGRRSDLSDGARVSLASYHDTVERSLERTERMVRDAGRRMREDLAIGARVDLAALMRTDPSQQIRVERASLGSGSLGGGAVGRRGGPTSRFGGLGGGFGGGGGGAGGAASGDGSTSARDAARYGSAGSGLTGPHVGTPGAGPAGPNLSGDARERAMQYYAGLRAGGLDAVHANALMGHATQETGGSFKGDSWNAKEGAGGMLQYRGNRLANLKRFAAEQGKPWTDPYVQGQFASAEQRMDPYEAKRAKSFMGATDIDTASREAGKNVVRFGDDTGPYRQRMARAFQDGSAYETLQGPAGRGAVAGSLPPRDGAGGVDQRQGGARHRRQAITPALRDQLAYAGAQSGVNAEVFSGGQDAHGPNRTGSHRHDHGRSADVRLYRTDENGRRKYLSMNDPADRTVMEGFIRNSVKAGATGVGAGPGYMGEHGIHIGGGSPLAWGAGGRAANAPDWVQRAHREGMEARSRDSIDAGAWAAKRHDQAPEQPLPPQEEARSRRELPAEGRPGTRSPRFTEPRLQEVRARPAAEPAVGGLGGRSGGAGGPVTQNFYGGFDEQTVARRAQLERNRAVRNAFASTLGDVGRPG